MDNIKRKVLFFINLEVGGGERMSVNISKMLPHDEFCLKYVIIKDKKYEKSSTSIIDFIPQESDITILDTKNQLDKVWKFFRIIKKQKPDIVFASHYNIIDKILIMKPFLRGVKFIIRAENQYSTFSTIKKLIIRLTYSKADVLIAQTDEMKANFVDNGVLPSSQVVTLENPVDKEYIEEKLANVNNPFPNDGNKHILAVGRFGYQKGYDFLVKAFAKVVKPQKNVDLYIVGSNLGKWQSEYERVMAIAKDLCIDDMIHCVGFNDNPYQYIKYADCFVLSSRWEGLPNVLVESLYLQTPVAAFKCIPIIERMVRDGVDGCLAEPENVDSLAIAIKGALKMNRTNPEYKGASKEDFVNLFKSI